MDDEHDLFAEAMGKVKPIEPQNKVSLEKTKRPRIYYKTAARHAQVIERQSGSQCMHRTDDPCLWRVDGVSRDTIKRLAAGQPAIDRSLDLHGFSRDAALDLLQQTVEQAIAEQLRVVCIVHGRGLHSEAGKAVLKEAVYHWLSSGPLAHLFLAAIPQPGSGGGACLLLLRRTK